MTLLGDSLGRGTHLWAVARRVLARERSYTQAHVRAKLEAYFKVSPEKAEDGFNLMVKQGVLIPTCGKPPRFFLSDTTPF